MQTGTVGFTARTSGILMDEFSVGSPQRNINFLTCSISTNEVIKVTANLEEVYYEDWPVQDVVQEVQRFLYMLSFHFNCPISSLVQSGYSLKKNDGSGLNRVSSSCVMMFDIASTLLKPGIQTIKQFKQRFIDFRHSASLRLYSSAIQQEDPIARFMFLYNIILIFSRDRQAEVDINILSIAPETPTTLSPIKRNMHETVYTRLRNEIAHNRGNADFDATSREITERVSELRKITKEFILRTLNEI